MKNIIHVAKYSWWSKKCVKKMRCRKKKLFRRLERLKQVIVLLKNNGYPMSNELLEYHLDLVTTFHVEIQKCNTTYCFLSQEEFDKHYAEYYKYTKEIQQSYLNKFLSGEWSFY